MTRSTVPPVDSSHRTRSNLPAAWREPGPIQSGTRVLVPTVRAADGTPAPALSGIVAPNPVRPGRPYLVAQSWRVVLLDRGGRTEADVADLIDLSLSLTPAGRDALAADLAAGA